MSMSYSCLGHPAPVSFFGSPVGGGSGGASCNQSRVSDLSADLSADFFVLKRFWKKKIRQKNRHPHFVMLRPPPHPPLEFQKIGTPTRLHKTQNSGGSGDPRTQKIGRVNTVTAPPEFPPK